MVLINTFVFLTLFILATIYLQKNTLIRFVLYIYLVMIVSSVVLGLTSSDYSIFDGSHYNGFIFFSISLLLLLSPLIILSYNQKSFDVIYIPSDKILLTVNLFFIFFSLISISHFSNVIYKILTFQDLENFRHILVSYGHPFIKPSLVNTISGVVATFYTFTLYLFFVNIVKGGSKLVSILLFIGSLSYPTFVFSYFGRDGFVFWVFSFISLFLLFKDFIPKEVTNNIIIVVKLFVMMFMFIFLFISFVRFGSFEMVLKAILEYFGQQPHIFAEIFNINLTPRLGLSSFSFISSIYLDSNHADIYLSELGSQLPLSWKFGTLLKNFYLDFGSVGSFVFLISISFFISLFFLYKKSNFFKLYVFFAYTQILIQGVFYFRQYNDVGNLYLICLIIVAIVYRFIPCSVIIRKN